MIKNSCNSVKTCAKCHNEVYSFEKRKNLNNGRVEHLRGQCTSFNKSPANDGVPLVFIYSYAGV